MAKENDVKVVNIKERFAVTDASVEQIFTDATTGLVSKAQGRPGIPKSFGWRMRAVRPPPPAFLSSPGQEEYAERRELLQKIVEEQEAKRKREEEEEVRR